jgi:ABC-type transporter Mla MlaB component
MSVKRGGKNPPEAKTTRHIESLTGAQTILEAMALRERLIDIVRDHETIEIDCAGLEEADVTFLQLLIAAGKAAVAAKKSFTLGACSDAMVAVLRRAGFIPDDARGTPSDLNCWLAEAVRS